MTQLSKPDNDKMFSDMAENGSGGYTDREYDDEDYDENFSGSGDDRSESKKNFNYIILKYFLFLLTVPSISTIDSSTPNTSIPKNTNPNAGNSLRISLSTLFAVLLSSYVVISFKF